VRFAVGQSTIPVPRYHDLAVMLGVCVLCAMLISHRVTEVARGLAPGPHTLHCELLEPARESKGGNEFRIFAVVH
jgi:hypothetical protein